MNALRSASLRFVLAGFAAFTTLGAAFAAPLTKEQKDEVLRSIRAIIENEAYVPGIDFMKWDSFTDKHKKEFDDAPDEDGFRDAVNNSLSEFGFSHMALMSPKAAEIRNTGSMVGIGITISPDPDGLLVVRVLPDGPAKEGGLLIGDVIIEADGKKPEGVTSLLGDEGKSLKLKLRGTDGKTRTVTLVRRKFSTIFPATLTKVDASTMMLRLPTFDNGYNRSEVEDLMEKASKVKNLIVDLRGNGGGAVLNLMHFTGLFLPANTAIGTFLSRQQVEEYVKETGGNTNDLPAIARWTPLKLRTFPNKVEPYKGHVAVLVDGGSGSAAEMAAAAFREKLSAPVLGQKSAGAVLASIFKPVSNGFQLQFPINDYITLNGLRLEGNGVVPDLEVVQPKVILPGQEDPTVVKAALLLGRAPTKPGL